MRRVDYCGAFHHIMCRGNNGNFIFNDRASKEFYLLTVEEYKAMYDVKLLAYCVMSNHVHLLVQSGKLPIGEFMRIVQTTFSKWYHKQNNSYGVVFSGRFKSICVNCSGYYYNLLRYIHLNPVKDGLSSTLAYPYSSYNDYMSGKGIIDFPEAFGIIGDAHSSVKKRFIDILNRDEKSVILEAIQKLRVDLLFPMEQLDALMVLLDYDKTYMLGHDQPPYYRELRALLIRTIRSEMTISTNYLSIYFKISKTHLYKLYADSDVTIEGKPC